MAKKLGLALSQDPPRRLKFALAQFELGQRRVLDVGCGPGTYLRYFGPGSVGLDLEPERARSKGLDARRWNFVDGIPEELRGEFDAVWCSALLEHVLAPHQLLIQMRAALRGGGTLVVVVPQSQGVPRVAPFGPFRAHLALDHVNFFTTTTLAWTIERAGYELTYVGNPSLPELLPVWVGKAARLVGPNLLAVAVPIPDFQYPRKAQKRLVGDRIEFKEDSL